MHILTILILVPCFSLALQGSFVSGDIIIYTTPENSELLAIDTESSRLPEGAMTEFIIDDNDEFYDAALEAFGYMETDGIQGLLRVVRLIIDRNIQQTLAQ